MITTPTVFILGAGASVPYGFPTGPALVTQLCEHGGVRDGLVRAGCSGSLIEEFRAALWRSRRYSIDAFLEHRPSFRKIGKLAIAAALSPLEVEGNLFPREGADDWYRFLADRMASAFDDFANNKVSFITFNYDRSLEHFLTLTLSASHGRTMLESLREIQKLSIFHVYGALGDYASELACGRPFPHQSEPADLSKAASGIHTMGEQAANQNQLEQVASILRRARRIIFLGFGYSDMNMEMLDWNALRTWDWAAGYPALFGSVFGLRTAEVSRVRRSLRQAAELGTRDQRSLEFLRESVDL